jgi:hypothetical protein
MILEKRGFRVFRCSSEQAEEEEVKTGAICHEIETT